MKFLRYFEYAFAMPKRLKKVYDKLNAQDKNFNSFNIHIFTPYIYYFLCHYYTPTFLKSQQILNNLLNIFNKINIFYSIFKK